MTPILLLLVRLHLALVAPQPGRGRDERGDVPGWVMVTVMSAGVVAVLTPLLRTELSQMLRNALSSVR
ncbi:hypothetical protein [Nocardioides sp. AX2bis]|uniref:hypothetical protein n=1 Tax=Nocardioides sp. AX2bis TaxID=2653157 RepID=UPI0012F40F40|nr:hypothetical protein [Nocardioides sp. AX2bis]VXB92698.1 conserved hypothetical protein [Nocardioides sp. AX2bis]